MNVPRKSVLSTDQLIGMLEAMPGMTLYRDDYGTVSVARNEQFEKLPPDEQDRVLKHFIAALHLEAGLEI
jgi:truncated hemoglobin YjbI